MKKILLSLRIFIIVLLSILILFVPVAKVLAQGKIESTNYQIQMPNLNSGAGIPTSTNYKMDTTIGQTAAGLFSSTGYRVKSGFQYIHSIIPFSFKISSQSVDFGTLTAESFVERTQTLTVSSGGAGAYQVTAIENHPLQLISGTTTIPDTTCNAGTCNETTAGVWNQTTKFGFGFNMTGNDIPADFTDNTYFRQFADSSNSETPKVVMSSVIVGRNRISTVTYKVNISGTQAAGTYGNVIKYTAVPTY